MSEPLRPLVDVRDLHTWFPVHRGFLRKHVADVKAVDGVSFQVFPGETLSLVGESGCGKTTVGRSILRLIEPTRGGVSFDGEDLLALSPKELRARRRWMQIIFQDPYGSLNPRKTVGQMLAEALEIHNVVPQDALQDEIARLLTRVGLQPSYALRYPHEFSGGQRQRLGIARALAPRPKFIVCDESVSALDVSVQAQVINLLREIQEETGLAYLFIAHDLSVVRHISDRVAVMYLGHIVELASTDALFAHPAHPYTQALLSSIPVPDPRRRRERIILQGEMPSPISPPPGCPFHTRCPVAHARCRTEKPLLRDLREGHAAACHLYDGADEASFTQTQTRIREDVRASGASSPSPSPAVADEA